MRVSDEGRRGGWVREERGKDVIKKSNEEVREIKFREEREYNKKNDKNFTICEQYRLKIVTALFTYAKNFRI